MVRIEIRQQCIEVVESCSRECVAFGGPVESYDCYRIADLLNDRTLRILYIHSRGFTFDRRKLTISSVDVPGKKISATPACLSFTRSSWGTIPPTSTRQSSIPCSRNNWTIRGQSVLWAPLNIETPTASTSSCSAAAAIISGVCRKPV